MVVSVRVMSRDCTKQEGSVFKWEDGISFQLSPITFSTVSVLSLVTKATKETFAYNAVLQVFPSVVHVAVASHLMVGPGEIRCTCLG